MGRQPLTGMDDVERQAIHGDPEILEKNKAKRSERCTGCIFWTLAIFFSFCVAILITIYHLDAHYYVVIDSVSGLDNPVEGLSFNLTLGVGSWTYGYEACIKPATYVEVSYRGFQLAGSEPETGQLCAGPMETADQHVVARVTGLPAGQVLESIVTDMEQGALVYDVKLHLPAGSYGAGAACGKNWVTDCGGKRVGAAAAWCHDPTQKPIIVVR